MSSRRERIWRPLAAFASWLAIGFAAVLLAALAVPLASGDRPFVVRSGSMAPAIDTGDVVVVQRISPGAAQIGDVVTFEDPDGTGRLITHRARAIEPRGDRLRFVTQGDANAAPESWTVPASGEIGRVKMRVPKLGFIASRVTTPAGRIGLLIVPALLLAASLLHRIWRTGGEEVPGEQPA